MLAVLTDPNDQRFVDWVLSAATFAGVPRSDVLVLPITLRGLSAREYGGLVRSVDACVVDVDQADPLTFMALDASLAANFAFWQRSLERQWNFSPNAFDDRVVLVTRQAITDNHITRELSDYYTSISLVAGTSETLAKELGAVLREVLASAVPRVFLSYRSPTRDFARRVARALRSKGAHVWFDEIQIIAGDSIPGAINRGLHWSTHFVMVVDDSYFASGWTQAEVEAALHKQLSFGAYPHTPGTPRPVVPLFLIDPSHDSVPMLLRRIRGIDCRNQSFRRSMAQLWTAVSAVVAPSEWDMCALRARVKGTLWVDEKE